MTFSRRAVLQALGALAIEACASAPRRAQRTTAPKRILILGGTGFVGPPIVEAARAGGHQVTLFNRGVTNPTLFPHVETILGDRITQLDRLAGRDWDVVVDTWAPGPTLVTRAAELLRGHIGHYLYVSTISVYQLGRDPIDEGSPLTTLPPGVTVKDIKKIDETVYGPLKVLAEQAAENAMPGRTTSIRAGVLVGPGDPSDRFLYWPERFSRGGEVAVSGAPDDRLPFLDVRDLGAFVIECIERGSFGPLNAVGPENPALGSVLTEVARGVGASPTLSWLDEKFLDAQDARGWENFPLVVLKGDEQSGFGKVSAAKALARGLSFRPVAETARDALAWWREQPEAVRKQARPGLTAEREQALLRAWHQAHP